MIQQLLSATQRVIEKVAADPHHESEINKEDRGDIKREMGGGPMYGGGGHQSFSNGPPPQFGSQQQSNGGYGYSSPFGGGPTPQKFNPTNGLGNAEVCIDPWRVKNMNS